METRSETPQFTRGDAGDPISAPDVRAALDRILASTHFQNAGRLRQFLTATVDYVLQGRAAELKEYSVATAVFGRPESFDPRLDSVVRVEARRLRAKLAAYYASDGASESIEIELPKGSYAPEFRRRLPTVRAAPRSAKHTRFITAFVLFFAITIYAGWRIVTRPKPVQSIAILPFLALSNDPETAYFADGLVDEATSTIAHVPGLRVASRTAAFRFSARGHDLRQVGRELNVDAIVEGSVRPDGSRLRVTAQLIDVRSGYHLWSATYDRNAGQTLGLANEISAGLTRAIRGATAAVPKRKEPANLQARDLFWKGLYLYKKSTPEDYQRSVEAFEDAVRLEPDYAAAHAALSAAYALLGFHRWSPPSEAIPRARAAAKRAISLDDSMTLAHGAQAIVNYAHDHNWPAAEASFRRAITADPQSADVRYWFSLALTTRQRTDEAITEARKAVELDPVTYVANHLLGVIYYSTGRYQEACDSARAALDANPNHYGSRALLGTCLLALGQAQAAVPELEKALALTEPRAFILGRLGHAYAVVGQRAKALECLSQLETRKDALVGFQNVYVAHVYAGLGDREKALQALEDSVPRGDSDLLFTLNDFLWDPYRTHPRFQALKSRLGLP
ncbi:MAG: tetratricopeptide repeat protein [Acidobacteria bacterium]|nr:tetratricopeptide repeat protein [Acidobacteriota bacterium]